MDAELITTLVTAIGGSAGGALTAGWLAKLLIKRFLKDNDKKHDLAASALQAIAGKLGEMVTELAVIRTTLGQVVALKEQVAKDHDHIIELRTWNEKSRSDLTAQFGKIRQVEKDMDEICNLISHLRRGAGNGK